MKKTNKENLRHFTFEYYIDFNWADHLKYDHAKNLIYLSKILLKKILMGLKLILTVFRQQFLNPPKSPQKLFNTFHR